MRKVRVTNSKKHGRSKSGALTVELAVGSLYVLVMMTLAINITILMLGYQINDRACRNACRAAAQSANETLAIQAANSVLENIQVDGTFLQKPELLTGAGNFVYNDLNGQHWTFNPGTGDAHVIVTTQMRVKTPAPIFFFGSAFGDSDGDGVGDEWNFVKRYTFPIVTMTMNNNNP